MAEHRGSARARSNDRGEHSKGRCLPGAIGPEQAKHLTFVTFETDGIHGMYFAASFVKKVFGQVAN
jgi:hypothetical protein